MANLMDNLKLRILKADLTKALENTLVFTTVANSSFSGEINQKGDTVVMDQMGDININTYDDTDITNQDLTLAERQITADQDKYFSFQLDTIEYNNRKSQLLSEAVRKAGYAGNENIDQYLAGLYAQSGIGSATYTGSDASPIDMNSANVEDTFLAMAELFAEAGIPRESAMYAIIAPWVTTKLTLAGITSKTRNDDLYKMGYHTTALGWDFVESNNVSKNSTSWDKTRIMCGVYGQSLGFASAVSTLESTQMEKRIGKTLTKGRFVYGGKVVRSDMSGTIYADKTAEA